MPRLSPEQEPAVLSRGNVIVSASAGSGKTFVMIEKLVRAVEEGVDLTEILAVTFTKKATAQMKEKLRLALIKRMETADREQKERLKGQLAAISAADISTIHAFCAKLLRTHFYALGVDAGFDIMSGDDSSALDLKDRAAENVFSELYERGDGDFLHLVERYSYKHSDARLKEYLFKGYNKVRTHARYIQMLEKARELYTEEGFFKVCSELKQNAAERYDALAERVIEFRAGFRISNAANARAYNAIFGEMLSALDTAKGLEIFDEKPALITARKPNDTPEDREEGKRYGDFKDKIQKAYRDINDFGDEETAKKHFIESGRTAAAFADLLIAFDGEYTRLKRAENKLDYNDLEHLTLELLQSRAAADIRTRYKRVFVDEYQDVNPVQEEIISALTGETFLVGDVKQAIYGFRGSKSVYFSNKFRRFENGEGTALRLTGNFRSSPKVIDFVNSVFSSAMTLKTCGIDYKSAPMRSDGGYPEGSGSAFLRVFGKEQKEREQRTKVYSVMDDGRTIGHTREGLAVLSIVKEELKGQRFDLSSGKYVDTQQGDICILVRKNNSGEGIVRALRDGGYSVSGAKEGNIFDLPEVKCVFDILSVIDNAAQDVPLVSALLSPLGGLNEEELAEIRLAGKDDRRAFFECCKDYAARMRTPIAAKLNTFFKKLEDLRDMAEVLTAGELVDEVLESTGLEAVYAADGGEKLANVLRFSGSGADMTLAPFLNSLKAGGYNIPAPPRSSSDSIKIMTIHDSKGLEFPVVILADICRTFEGEKGREIPFDEEYGFVHNFFDDGSRKKYPTLLGRLCREREEREELKNDLNVFYVACTRAQYSLHVLSEELLPADAWARFNAKCYARTFDMNAVPCEILPDPGEISGINAAESALAARPDEQVFNELQRQFMREYPHADSIDLPLKSSASAILKSRSEDEPYAVKELFGGEGETDADRGTAYHRFLQLCDFSVIDKEGIAREIAELSASGKLLPAQARLLNADELFSILSMPVFATLKDCRLMREQEFLCKMRACDIMDVKARDEVLVQGAMDLIAVGESGVRIVDYKYSKKGEEELKRKYAPQLALYRRAASIIMKVPPESIRATIVNIFARYQTEV